MKRVITILSLSILIISCNNESKQIEVVKNDIIKKGDLTKAEIETLKFSTLEMISVDGKNELISISTDRKMEAIKEGAVFGLNFDICKNKEIKENDKISKITAYRIATDTVYKSLYFVDNEKIVGRFMLK